MYAIIPSKKIYSLSNDKVANNKIDLVSVTMKKLTLSDTTDTVFDSLTTQDTKIASATSASREYGTNREENKGHATDTITAQFVKSDIPFTSNNLVDWSKLDVKFKFSTDVLKSNNLSHTGIAEYETYAVNSEPRESLAEVPPPNYPLANFLVDPTTAYVDNLFKRNVFYTLNIRSSTSATITIYFVRSVTVERKLVYDLTPSANKTISVTLTAKDMSATVSSIYKNEETITETFGVGKKAYSYPSADLLVYGTPFGADTLDYTLANNLITQYANGKEVATVVCEIGEYDFYYRNNANSQPVRVVSQYAGTHSFAVPWDKVEFGKSGAYNTVKVNLDFAAPSDIFVNVPWTNLNGTNTGTFTLTIVRGETSATLITNVTGTIYKDENSFPSAQYSNKPVFQIGDTVLPMVKGADGADRALSFYSDGTPKKFFVAATKVYYDGAVWQELTLKEENRIV